MTWMNDGFIGMLMDVFILNEYDGAAVGVLILILLLCLCCIITLH